MKSFMPTRRQALALALGGATQLGLVACGGSRGDGASPTENDSYIIATDTTFAPFEYAEADGTYVGIDIDLLAAIAEDQGFSYELNPVGFDAALQNVQSGQADGVIAGMSIDNERRKTFDFSEPYYDSTVCAAALADGTISSLDDLEGANVAVKTGTMSQKWAESIAEEYGFTTVIFADSPTMYADVVAGNTLACFEDTPVMAYAINTNPDNVPLKLIAEVEADSEFATPYGFAVNKGANAELLSMFDAGLANIKANGTYDEIIEKYLSTSEE